MKRADLNSLVRAALEGTGADDHFGAAETVAEMLDDEQCRIVVGWLLPAHARQIANEMRTEAVHETQARLAVGRPLTARGRKLNVDTKIEPLFTKRAPFLGKVVGSLGVEDVAKIVESYDKQSNSNREAARRWDRVLALMSPGDTVADLPIAAVVEALGAAMDLAESA